MRWDARLLIVDAREAGSARSTPLNNRFFGWVRIVNPEQAERLSRDLVRRHLLVVHEDEERALDLDHVFKTLELQSWALEGGESGWREALVEENADTHGDAVVVTLNQLAYNRRQYLIVHDGSAIAVQPSGSVAALREEARHYGARIEATIDVLRDLPAGTVFHAGGIRLCRHTPDLLNVRDASHAFDLSLEHIDTGSEFKLYSKVGNSPGKSPEA